MHGRRNKGEDVPLAAETRREGEREEINADYYSRNLMRSHLPGTWPWRLYAREPRSLFLLPLSKWPRIFRAARSLVEFHESSSLGLE